VDNAREIQRGDLDVLHVSVEQLQVIVGDSGLLRVLHANSELVRIRRREIECQTVIVTHSLDELEEVDHIDSEHMLHGAEVVLKAIGV